VYSCGIRIKFLGLEIKTEKNYFTKTYSGKNRNFPKKLKIGSN